MIVIYSGVGITDAAGRIGGTILSGNIAGRTASIFRRPKYRNSQKQQSQRGSFLFINNRWRGLPVLTRQAWVAAAASGVWDWVNNLGQPFRPSGQQLFVKLNLSLGTVEGSIVSPPVKPIITPNLVSSAIAANPATLDINFTDPTIGISDFIIIYATLNQSPGVMLPAGSTYRLIGFRNAITFSQSFSIAAEYLAIFPALTAGQGIFLKTEIVDGLSGHRIKNGEIKAVIV